MAEESNVGNVTGPAESGTVSRLWNNLQAPAKVGIAAVAGLVMVLLVLFSINQVTPTEMDVLFRRLDPVQAREIASRLDDMNVPYEIADDGSTILVPPDQRDRLRLNLSPDLYAQGIGFALFENGGLVSSDFERRVQWQIALEEELRRTITSIDAIDQARVHLVMVEEGLFIRDRQEPSASVFVRLAPLASLSDAQVRGILSLVAGSVEGLNPESVTIVDSAGNTLYDAYAAMDDVSVSNAVQSNLQLTRQFETELENRLRSILEQVYGPGKAVAMVSAELDFDTRERTILTFNDNPVPRSTHRIDERSESMGPAGEEVGEPNIPGQAAVLGAGGGESMYERVEEIVNYEVGEMKEYVMAAPGQVTRLSTAVIIDGDNNDPFVEERVVQLVNSAIGFDAARGDIVTVQLIPFDAGWLTDLEPGVPAEPGEAPFPLLWAIIGAALLFFILLLLILVMRARARRRDEDEELDALALEEEMEARLKKEQQAASPGEAESKAQSIRKMVKDEPESVAGLLKTWLAEE